MTDVTTAASTAHVLIAEQLIELLDSIDERNAEPGVLAIIEAEVERQQQLATVETYRATVAAIGLGFHPDTRGDGYTELPAGLSAAQLDATVDAVVDLGLDPYLIAAEVLGLNGEEG